MPHGDTGTLNFMETKKVRMSPFTLKVISMVKSIPRGKVATYGQIAALAGKPHAARGVGWILNACAESHKLPWQRVLNSQGRISFSPRLKEFKLQRKLLQREGVRFTDDRSLSLEVYQWPRGLRPKRRKRGTPGLFSGS